MTWTPERKRDACVRAPLGEAFVRADSEILARDGWYEVITPSAPGAMLNEVILSRVAPDEAESAIDAALARHPHGLKWCVGPWTSPDDFGERLARRGFTAWNVRGMGCATDLEVAAPAIVEEASDLEEYVDVASRGWGLPAEQREHELAAHRRALAHGVLFFVARVAGEAVGTAGVVVKEDHGYLLGAQVLAAARGRGAYRALVAARLAALRERGRGYAVTQAREETSVPRLEALGFETLFRSRCFLR